MKRGTCALRRLAALLAALLLPMLCTVNAGAEETPPPTQGYTDADVVAQSEYAEAILLVTELGLMQGDANGEFRPRDGITRAEAAKLAAGLVLGSAEAASSLAVMTDVETGFPDVDAADSEAAWARGYILFCKEHKIVAGKGDGSFAPGELVTGQQFAKMLLAALGYNSLGELEGVCWATNVWVRGTETGLLPFGVTNSGRLRREAAAQYLLNALCIPHANFDPETGRYAAPDPATSYLAAHGLVPVEATPAPDAELPPGETPAVEVS